MSEKRAANLAEKESNSQEEGSVHNHLSDLSTFKFEKVLSNNTNRKVVCLQGSFEASDGVGIVVFEKTAFEEGEFKEDSEYFNENSLLKKQFHNDIYGNYEYFPKIELNCKFKTFLGKSRNMYIFVLAIKTTIIHPATEKHIEKYSVQNLYIVDETPEIYKNITLPHLVGEQFDLQVLCKSCALLLFYDNRFCFQWVYNILEHKSESERIVFEDPNPETGFILLPDLKWNGTTLDTLYLLALTHKRGIKSLRDLTFEHLPLLKNILEKGSVSLLIRTYFTFLEFVFFCRKPLQRGTALIGHNFVFTFTISHLFITYTFILLTLDTKLQE